MVFAKQHARITALFREVMLVYSLFVMFCL